MLNNEDIMLDDDIEGTCAICNHPIYGYDLPLTEDVEIGLVHKTCKESHAQTK